MIARVGRRVFGIGEQVPIGQGVEDGVEVGGGALVAAEVPHQGFGVERQVEGSAHCGGIACRLADQQRNVGKAGEGFFDAHVEGEAQNADGALVPGVGLVGERGERRFGAG